MDAHNKLRAYFNYDNNNSTLCKRLTHAHYNVGNIKGDKKKSSYSIGDKISVKSTSPQVNFDPYQCYCGEKLNHDNIPLICNSTSLACILKNYFLYIKSRNLFCYLENNVISKLEHLQKNDGITNEVQKIKISPDSNYAKLATISNKTLTLVLKSPRADKGLARMVDTLCCKEFEEFINKHLFCEVDKSSIQTADEVLAQCTKSNNKY